MTTTFNDNIIELSAKTESGESFYETKIPFMGHNFVWLDVAAQEELQLFVAINDATKNITQVLINHTVIPKGAFLTLFSNKLISNKTIIIRTTNKAAVYFESKTAV